MINMDFKQLVKKLNAHTTSALESAVGLCMSNTHYEITLHHFLLKLLEHTNAEICLLLNSQQYDIDQLKRKLQRKLSNLPIGNSAKPIFAPNIFSILEQAWMIASINLNTSTISSGSLLLGLIDYERTHHHEHDFASINFDSLYKDFFKLIDNTIEQDKNTHHSTNITTESALNKFCEDLTEKAKTQQLDPVYGREHEIRQMIDVLCRRRKNNPILVGEAGVGKTALLEGLANKIASGEVPETLKKVRLLVLDLAALEAGASVKGEFEHRIKNILIEIQHSEKPIIIFIDEAHLLIGAGGQNHDAANLLKPALARGNIRAIAATTWSEYKKYIEKDPALTRRFQRININAPNDEQCLMILRGLRKQYESAHQVTIRDDALITAVSLSTRYIPDRQQPDKAIDLLDTATARVKVNLATKPPEIEQLELQIATLTREHEGLTRDQSYGLNTDTTHLTKIKSTLANITSSLKKTNEQWQKEQQLAQKIITLRAQCQTTPSGKKLTQLQQQCLKISKNLSRIQNDTPLVFYEVDPDCIAKVVSDWTHIPLGKVLRDEASSILLLDEQLQTRIKGQNEGLTQISEHLKMAKSGLKDPRQPVIFLLVGPSGVGKTETALTVADTLFGGEDSLIAINMSEFQEKHTISRLIGSPPGYVGYGEGGRLTEAVRKRPYSVILLDEVEKASLDVLNLFYQVFDKGSLTDGEGREVDFSQTVIFLTSNLTTQEITELCTKNPHIPLAELLKNIRPILSQWFKPALLARLNIIPYKNLTIDELSSIAKLKLDSLARRLHEQYKIDLTFNQNITHYLASNCLDIEMGARNIDAIIKAQLMPDLSTLILESINTKMPKTLNIGLSKNNKITLQ